MNLKFETNKTEDRNVSIVEKIQFNTGSLIYQTVFVSTFFILIYFLIRGGEGIGRMVDLMLTRTHEGISSYLSGHKGWDEFLYFLKSLNVLFVFAISIYPGFIVHKLLHSIGYCLFGHKSWSKVILKWNWDKYLPLADYSVPLKINSHRWAELLPGIVLGLFPILVGLIFDVFFLVLWGIILFIASINDFAFVWNIHRTSTRLPKPASYIAKYPQRFKTYKLATTEDVTRAVAMADNTNRDKHADSTVPKAKSKSLLPQIYFSVFISLILTIIIMMQIPVDYSSNRSNPAAAAGTVQDSGGVGNTAGNHANGGFLAAEGEFVYFQNEFDSLKLYKMRFDGSDFIKLTDDYSYSINVLNGWVYYINYSDDRKIYKIKTDGSSRMKLSEDDAGNIFAAGEWIYYTNNRDGSKLYRTKTDGSGRTKLCDDKTEAFAVYGGWIFYSNGNDGRKLYKIKTDGSGRMKMDDKTASFINTADGWVYYVNTEYNIYKMKTDGSSRKLVTNGYITGINVDGGWIYYCNLREGGRIYRIKTDGSAKESFCSDSSLNIAVGGDWIFYSNYDDSGFIYKVRKDGSGRSKLK